MNLTIWINDFPTILNAVAVVACILLSAEYIQIVRIRKPPYPWASYSVSFALFALACQRFTLLLQPQTNQTAPWHSLSCCLTDLVLLLCATLIPLVRKQTYQRPKFKQLQQINEELKYSQQLLQSYLEEAPVVAYIKDSEGLIIQLNKGYSNLFKRQREEVIGKSELWGDPVSNRQRDEEILAGKGEKLAPESLRVADEEHAVYDIRFPLSGPDNEKMLGGIVVDMTERMKWKNRIEVFVSIVELSPDPIYCYDDSGQVITWNAAAERMFGYGHNEMIGQSIRKIIPDDKLAELDSIVETLRKSADGSISFETIRLTRDGRQQLVAIAAARVNFVDPGSASTAPASSADKFIIACVARDIAQKKETDDQIKALHKELELRVEELRNTNIDLVSARDRAIESAALKSAFVANISHELRTPLSGILGMSELLCLRTLDEDMQRMLSMTHESAKSLLHVVEDILDLAKLEAGKTTSERSHVQIHDLARECVRLFSPAATARNLALRLTVSDAAPEWIGCDQAIVRRVLVNLLSNALKFTKEGAIDLSLELENASGNKQHALPNQGGEPPAPYALKFVVVDSGVGVSESQLPLLLTPMVQVTQALDGTSGAGLGLCVSKQLVELIGGQIGCQSEIDRGSTFWFTVPFTVVEPKPLQRPLQMPLPMPMPMPMPNCPPGVRPADKALKCSIASSEFEIAKVADTLRVETESKFDLARFKILVVDDNPLVSRLTTLQLSSIGVEAAVAMTGEEAIEKARQTDFDLILMDVQLPDMTGFEVSNRIHQLEESSGKKLSVIIALTGCSSDEDKEAAAASGMDDYLTKPVSIDVLKEHLSRALSRKNHHS
jgi:PAS domain S-box-containing protein